MPQYGAGYRDVDDTEKPLRKVIDAFKVFANGKKKTTKR